MYVYVYIYIFFAFPKYVVLGLIISFEPLTMNRKMKLSECIILKDLYKMFLFYNIF